MRFFSLIYQGDVHPESDDKVIPAEDFSTLMEAIDLLERARQDAKDYKKAVEEECETIKETARKEGFEQGLAEFNQHLVHFDKVLLTLRADLQKQILPLALKAAKKIVGDQLTLHPESIVDIVLQTVAPVTQNHRFVIYVNKADKEILENEKQRIREVLEHVQTISVMERPDISPGGCIIETESGIINASIENQWRALEAAFEKYTERL